MASPSQSLGTKAAALSQLRQVVSQLQHLANAFDPMGKDYAAVQKSIERLSKISAPSATTQQQDQQGLRDLIAQQQKQNPIIEALKRQAASMPQMPGGQPQGPMPTPTQSLGGAGAPPA